jgi:hypothetical protein
VHGIHSCARQRQSRGAGRALPPPSKRRQAKRVRLNAPPRQPVHGAGHGGHHGHGRHGHGRRHGRGRRRGRRQSHGRSHRAQRLHGVRQPSRELRGACPRKNGIYFLFARSCTSGRKSAAPSRPVAAPSRPVARRFCGEQGMRARRPCDKPSSFHAGPITRLRAARRGVVKKKGPKNVSGPEMRPIRHARETTTGNPSSASWVGPVRLWAATAYKSEKI